MLSVPAIMLPLSVFLLFRTDGWLFRGLAILMLFHSVVLVVQILRGSFEGNSDNE